MRFLLLFLQAVFLLGYEAYATFDVVAEKSAVLGAKSSGEIEKIFVDVGSRVKKGDILLKLDNEVQKINVKIKELDLQKAIYDYNQSLSTHNRYLKIKSVIDEEKLSQSLLNKNIKQQNYLLAKEALSLAKKAYKDSFITAPFSGVVSQKFLDVGNNVAAGTAVFELLDDSLVKLVLEFDERYWKVVKVGDEFLYKLDGDKEQRLGKISKVYPSVNVKNRKIKAEVISKNAIVGLFGDGKISDNSEILNKQKN